MDPINSRGLIAVTLEHVLVVGVNGMELDVIRPLLLKGEMPNLERIVIGGMTAFCNTASPIAGKWHIFYRGL